MYSIALKFKQAKKHESQATKQRATDNKQSTVDSQQFDRPIALVFFEFRRGHEKIPTKRKNLRLDVASRGVWCTAWHAWHG